VDEADQMLAELMSKIRAKRATEERQRALAAAAPMHAEGRRGRQRRELLAVVAPDELPSREPRAVDSRERAAQTRRESREALEKLVDKTAIRCSVSPTTVGAIVGNFLELVVGDLTHGACVVLPGFGALCARPSQERPGRRQRVYLAWAAARNVAVTVCEHAAFDPEAYRRWSEYRKNSRPSGRSWRRIALSPTQRVRGAWRNVGRAAAKQRKAG
jgi:nucleoid DNA-binding protein